MYHTPHFWPIRWFRSKIHSRNKRRDRDQNWPWRSLVLITNGCGTDNTGLYIYCKHIPMSRPLLHVRWCKYDLLAADLWSGSLQAANLFCIQERQSFCRTCLLVLYVESNRSTSFAENSFARASAEFGTTKRRASLPWGITSNFVADMLLNKLFKEGFQRWPSS